MSRALLRFIRLSPTKARLVAREVQGMNAELALASLEFTSSKAARIIAKVIASAVANGGYQPESVIIYSCRVDTGPVLRRFTPRAHGRATPIRKPTSHVLVEVLTQSEIDSRKGIKKPNKATKSVQDDTTLKNLKQESKHQVAKSSKEKASLEGVAKKQFGTKKEDAAKVGKEKKTEAKVKIQSKEGATKRATKQIKNEDK